MVAIQMNGFTDAFADPPAFVSQCHHHYFWSADLLNLPPHFFQKRSPYCRIASVSFSDRRSVQVPDLKQGGRCDDLSVPLNHDHARIVVKSSPRRIE